MLKEKLKEIKKHFIHLKDVYTLDLLEKGNDYYVTYIDDRGGFVEKRPMTFINHYGEGTSMFSSRGHYTSFGMKNYGKYWVITKKDYEF